LCSSQSKEECEHLIALATPHMRKSTVVDSATGGSKDSRFGLQTLLISLENLASLVVLISA
jgi:hypothetical protein